MEHFCVDELYRLVFNEMNRSREDLLRRSFENEIDGNENLNSPVRVLVTECNCGECQAVGEYHLHIDTLRTAVVLLQI